MLPVRHDDGHQAQNRRFFESSSLRHPHDRSCLDHTSTARRAIRIRATAAKVKAKAKAPPSTRITAMIDRA
jgi:hypothetical protein